MLTPTHIAKRITPTAPLAALIAAGTLGALAVSAGAAEAKLIPGRYIVTVKAGKDARGIAKAVDARPSFVYGSALNGFAAALNEGQLNALRHNPSVELVEQDGTVSATTTQTMDAAGDASWGLDRIDQLKLPLSKTYSYNQSGAGVRAYIIDTGLQADHPEYNARTAANVFNATATTATDCNGHGTHVAGTVGSRTFGVAKDAHLLGVKVLNCSGIGSWSSIIAGVDWVKANAIQPAVANMSLGGEANASVDTAVSNLIASGVFVAVAAGNENADACSVSPARVEAAYTTAATRVSSNGDERWPSSNWGPCVDGYAPGWNIKSTTLSGSSAWKEDLEGSGWQSGTSMASPHVTGTAALLCSYGPSYCTPSYITNWIKSTATPGIIAGNHLGTPNRLLNKSAL